MESLWIYFQSLFQLFFFNELENDSHKQLIQKFTFYHQHMDDIFITCKYNTLHLEVLRQFNEVHSVIKFTGEWGCEDGIAPFNILLTERIYQSTSKDLKKNTYLCLLPLVKEHRPPTRILQRALSWTILSSCLHLLSILLMPASDSRRNMFLGLLFFRSPSRFKVSAYLMTQFYDFLNVCPIHFQHLLLPIFQSIQEFVSFSARFGEKHSITGSRFKYRLSNSRSIDSKYRTHHENCETVNQLQIFQFCLTFPSQCSYVNLIFITTILATLFCFAQYS